MVDYMNCDYSSEMDYEYTNPLPFQKKHSNYRSPNQRYTPPPPGAFAVPPSFFEKPYSKTAAATNTVCDLLSNFRLDNDSTKQTSSQSRPEVNNGSQLNKEKINSSRASSERNIEHDESQNKPNSPLRAKQPTAPYSPSLTPPRDSEGSEFNTTSSVDQNNIPYVTTSLQSLFPTSSVPQTSYYHAPAVHNHSTPTLHYYYPQAVDPLQKSRSNIHYIAGICKTLAGSILFCTVFFVSGNILWSLYSDVVYKIEDYMIDTLIYQSRCQYKYTVNRCATSKMVPAIVKMCEEWEQCISKQPYVSKTRVLAETLAEIINTFGENISPKSLAMCFVFTIGIIWAAGSFYHSREQSASTQQQSVEPHQINTNLPRLQFHELSQL